MQVHRFSFNVLLFFLVFGAAVLTRTAAGQPVVLDDFSAPQTWRVIASDGVTAELHAADEPAGRALRLDFNFERGSGFCVTHRDVDLPLPKNYRFALRLRGAAAPNNLEFKLVDPSGQNVWWVNRRGFEFPEAWQTLALKSRQFSFAWGPSGGKPLDRVSAIEIAVSAANGGTGQLWIDRLTFEALPDSPPAPQPILVRSSSTRQPAATQPFVLPDSGQFDWQSALGDGQPWISVDFQQMREFGGLVLDWDRDAYAAKYDVQLSLDDAHWETAATLHGPGGRAYVPLPDAEARQARIIVRESIQPYGVRIRGLRVMGPEFAATPNAVLTTVAREAPRGCFPRYFLGEQPYWTVVGSANGAHTALLDADGALEAPSRTFRLEPFLFLDESEKGDDRLITWADAKCEPSLADGYLPIPSVAWRASELDLMITALADKSGADASKPDPSFLARYRVANRSTARLRGALFLAVRPFQVLPPWQELNITGGVANIDWLAWHTGRLWVNEKELVIPWTQPAGIGLAAGLQGDITSYLARGTLPGMQALHDPARRATGALRYGLDLAPGGETTVVVELPPGSTAPATASRPDATSAPAERTEAEASARFDDLFARARSDWTQRLSRVRLELPPVAAPLMDSFRAAQAHILVNARGPGFQPGPRTYARSWVRDGAISSVAMLYTGHPEAVRAFLDWYCTYQYANGKVPCVVDQRGPDPVPEHDSTGELLFALREYYLFTRDRAFLEQHLPVIVRGVDYIETLRRERLTPAYRDGTPEQRECYGLVPESISHEGYSAKPMHSYWDDFWVLRGLEDATAVAAVLGRADLQSRFAALRDGFRASLRDSLQLVLQTKSLDFIPGCVELGDFDATSTAVAVFPCNPADVVPPEPLRRTFARYYDFFRRRRDADQPWENYTPYELRLAATFVRLEQPDKARELLDFFLRDQRPAGWRQWPEVVWRDPAAAKFTGDMPHAWVGAEFINSVRSLFVYERPRDQALVLAAGVAPEWAAAPTGVAVSDLPTEYGQISYSVRSVENQVFITLDGKGGLPPGGIVFYCPNPRAIEAVQVDGKRVTIAERREMEGDAAGQRPSATVTGPHEVVFHRLRASAIVICVP